MAKRLPYTGQIPYMTARVTVTGYRPTKASRFAVARVSDKAPWSLIHVRTGMPVNSVLPALSRALTMADKLAVAAAWETLTHCDWSAFDSLEEIGPSFNGKQHLDPAKAMPTVTAMRQAAAQALTD